MRLPNNAYDALRTYTQKLSDDGLPASEIFETQLALLSNIPIFKDEVSRLRSNESNRELSEYARSRLLRLPAVGLKIPGQKTPTAASSSASSQPQQSTSSSPPPPTLAAERVYDTTHQAIPSTSRPSQARAKPPPPDTSTSASPPSTEARAKQKAQRADYIRMQREREQKARDERERIKAQIKADREERRRLDELRKQGHQAPSETDTPPSSSAYARSGSTRWNANAEVRVQVRTFDGSTLRNTFPPASTITDRLRPWIDDATSNNIPYNLKVVLTPLPNRTIEAGEEDTSLSDLGIQGSCTLIMVPVKGYVESYGGGTSGLMGQNGVLGGVGGMVSGGYNLVSGTAGWALGGVKSILGYGSGQAQERTLGGATPEGASQGQGPPKNMRVRTLADQRAEEAKKDQQFYNGNQLNFEPNKDDDSKKD